MSMMFEFCSIYPADCRTAEEALASKQITAKEEAANKLEEYDIVRNWRNRWQPDDFITRRDALKMAYIVRNVGRNVSAYNIENFETELNMYLEYESVQRSKYNYEEYYGFQFVDIDRNSTDFMFAVTMYTNELLYGREENGLLYADLDSYVTYNEAFAYIFRIFTRRYVTAYGILENVDWEYPYYEFCQSVNLINSTNPFLTTFLTEAVPLNVSIEQLDDNITAYDYMFLIYKSLYVECQSIGDYAPSFNFHFIDYFVERNGEKFRDNDIIND